MSPQQLSDSAGQPEASQASARQAGTVRQLTRRSFALARDIWTILSARRSVRITVGSFLLLLGIAGLFLPILQGMATIIAALAILRKDVALAERVWQRWIVPLEHRCQQWLQTFRQRRAGRRKDAG